MRKAFWIRLTILVGAVGLLEIFCRTGLVPDKMVTPPSRMLTTMVSSLASGKLWPDLRQTFTSVGISIVLSIVGGVTLGLALHALPSVRRAINPFLGAWYAIPHFAFYPLLVVIFGLGVLPLIVLATLFAMVVVIVATLSGLDRVPHVLLKTAKIHRLSRLEEMWRIRLPSAAPHLFSGIKLAVSYSFIGVIGGEFILSTAGIGHQIADSFDRFDNPGMYGLILLVLIITTGFNLMVYAYERALARRRGQ